MHPLDMKKMNRRNFNLGMLTGIFIGVGIIILALVIAAHIPA